MRSVESEEWNVESEEWDSERTFTSSGHPGAKQRGAIGSTLTETLGMDSTCPQQAGLSLRSFQNDGKQTSKKSVALGVDARKGVVRT